MISLLRQALILSSLCLVTGISLPGASRPAKGSPQSFANLVDAGFAALKRGELPKAEATARQALASPERYEGHFLLGLVSYRQGRLGAAELALGKALELAPVEQQAPIRKALAVLAARRTFLERQGAGAKAEEQGLMARAAQEYTAAWQADSSEEEVGFRAARLWIERTGSPEKAAPILGRIISDPRDAGTADQARQMLERLSPRLAKLSAQALKAGQRALLGGDLPVAQAEFRKAAEWMPSDPTPHLWVAECSARAYLKGRQEKQKEAVREALGQLFRMGASLPPGDLLGRMAERADLVRIAGEPAFQALFGEALGSGAGEQLTALRQKLRNGWSQALRQALEGRTLDCERLSEGDRSSSTWDYHTKLNFSQGGFQTRERCEMGGASLRGSRSLTQTTVQGRLEDIQWVVVGPRELMLCAEDGQQPFARRQTDSGTSEQGGTGRVTVLLGPGCAADAMALARVFEGKGVEVLVSE